MANSLSQALNILGTQAVVSDRPSYVEDPEEVLRRRQHEDYLKILPALEATEGRASATIGPTPYHETEEFRQEALDIAEGLAFPGFGIGASVSGGRIAKISEDLWHARGQKILAKVAKRLTRGIKDIRTIDASGKVVKARVGKTDLDYAKEKIPWWRELNKQEIRFLKGRGEKSFYNTPEEISRAVKPPIVSKKQFKEGIDAFPSHDNVGDWYYWQDYFTDALKRGVSAKNLQKKYGKVFTDYKAHPKEYLFESYAKRVKIEKDKTEHLLRKQWAKDIEFKNKMSKAKLEVQNVLKKYDIDDPDIYEDLLPRIN